MAAKDTVPDVVRGVLSVRIADASGVSKTQNGLQLWDPAFTEGFIKGTWMLPGDASCLHAPTTVEIRGGARTVKVRAVHQSLNTHTMHTGSNQNVPRS